MAEMEFVFGKHSQWIILQTLQYMCYPEDKELREKYLASEIAEVLLDSASDSEFVGVPVSVLQRVALAPPLSEFYSQAALISPEASLAGRAVLYYIELMETSGIDASLVKSKKLTANFMRMYGRDADGNLAKKKGETAIANALSKYGKVAHLWAALSLRVQLNGPDDALKGMSDDFLGFLSTAENILKKFESGFGEIESWTVPASLALPNRRLICRGMRDGDVKLAKAYKNTTKRQS